MTQRSIKEIALSWLESSKNAQESAKVLFENKKYSVCAFLCEQAIELGLKGLWVFKEGTTPPKTHDLPSLGGKLHIPEKFGPSLIELYSVSILSRYPDASGSPAVKFDHKKVETILNSTKEVLEWIRDQFPSH